MRPFVTAVCALALALLTPATLLAAPPTDKDKEAARTLANKGAELYEAGKYADAIVYFQKADQVVHAPTFVLAIAQAYAKIGKLTEARAQYQTILSERLPSGAPATFYEAQITAQKEVDELKRRIPLLQIVVTGAPEGGLTATVDGVAVPDLSQPVAQNPGEHTVVVKPSEGEAITQTVTLREGATERMQIAFATKVTEAPVEGGAKGSKGSIVPAALAFGVGGIGLGIGAVTGILALGKVGTIKEKCAGNVCPKSLEGDAGSAGTLADISTVGFIVGGVGLAAGTVLLFVRPGGGSGSDTSEKPAQQASFRASLGLGSLHVSGTF